MKKPLVSYDDEFDVLRLSNGKPSHGVWIVSDDLVVDFDENGKPASIELLDAAKLLLPLLCPKHEEDGQANGNPRGDVRMDKS